MRALDLAAAPSSWGDICRAHPARWVGLLDVERAPDGTILSARMIGHDRSLRRLEARAATLSDVVVAHTGGRTLPLPHT